MKRLYWGILFLLSASGCATILSAMTAGVSIKEGPTGIVVTQPAVVANSGEPGEGVGLGFQWSQERPDVVILVVNASMDDDDIPMEVSLNADGVLISVHALGTYVHLKWSGGGYMYSVDYQDFLRAADANDVMMKVRTGKEGIVPVSFGKTHSSVINKKLGPFVRKVVSIRESRPVSGK